jgi:protein phosphatase PTC7
MFGGALLHDFPKDSSLESCELQNGDVLVFGTDGVWDNLSSQDILNTISKRMVETGAWEETEKGTDVGHELRRLTRAVELGSEHTDPLQVILATAVTGKAHAASLNTKVDGPFAKEVQKYYPEEDYHGGKVDDICTIVAIVLED